MQLTAEQARSRHRNACARRGPRHRAEGAEVGCVATLAIGHCRALCQVVEQALQLPLVGMQVAAGAYHRIVRVGRGVAGNHCVGHARRAGVPARARRHDQHRCIVCRVAFGCCGAAAAHPEQVDAHEQPQHAQAHHGRLHPRQRRDSSSLWLRVRPRAGPGPRWTRTKRRQKLSLSNLN